MAANLTFKFLVDSAGLKKGVGNAKKQLSGFEKATKKASNGIKSALGGIGLGLSFAALTSALKDATKAAVEDQKSQALLANTLRNTTGASDEQIAAIEARISAMQTELAIADDQLRPAYAKLSTVLGDSEQTYAALGLAADVAAGTGKSLDTVTSALTKAFTGNLGALNKLVPATKGAANPIEKLAELFGGAAKAAADNDPFARLTIIFGELQEQLGTYLLPYLQQFVAFLSSEAGAAYMQNLVTNIGNFVVGLANSVDWLGKNFEAIKNMALIWAAVTVGIKAAQAAMLVYTASTGIATGVTATLGNVMKKSGWLAIALILSSLFADQLTGDVDYGDLSIPQMPLQSSLTGRSNSDPLAALLKQFENLKKVDTGKITGKAVDPMLERMKAAAKKMQEYAKRFRDSVDLAFGLNDKGNRFSAEKFVRELNRAVLAAEKLPNLLAQIRATKATGSTALANELAAMNPLQGSVIAEGLLSSGRLQEIGTLRNRLSVAGMQTGLAGGGSTAYTINVNKANMSASEIIAAIKAYERSTGKRVLLG
jgi:hypothetical protein